MIRFGKFVAGALLLMMLGVPAMACVIPEAQLSEAEKACCRQMKGDCGKMEMPNGHSCCETTVRPQQSAMLKSAPSLSSHQVVLAVVPVAMTAPKQIQAAYATIRALRHPPPGTHAPTIEILRI